MNIRRDWIEITLLVLGFLFYLFVFPHGTYGDGWSRYLAVEALARDGQWMPHKYPMLGPLFSVPLYALGWAIKHPHWWVSRYNSFLFLGFLLSLPSLLRTELSASSIRRLMLLLLTGTMFSKHVTDYYGEVFTVVLAALSVLWIVNRRSKLGIFGMALSAVSNPPSLIAGALSAAWFGFFQKRLRFFLVPVIAGLLILTENFLRFGAPISHQYLNDVVGTTNALPYARMFGFHYPFLFGVLSIFLSFGKGILFYAPGLLLAWPASRLMTGRLKEIHYSWLFYLLGLVLMYAKWCAWPGDWFWGPRYFLFASLISVFSLHMMMEKKEKPLWENIAVLGVLLLSVWVGLDGVAFGQNNLEECGLNGGYLMGFCWYTPEYSALWRPFLAEKTLNGKQLAFTIYFSLVFLYLSFDLWKEITRQTGASLRQGWNRWGRISEWHF